MSDESSIKALAFFTTDLNLAAYLLYHGVEAINLAQNEENKTILFYEQEKARSIVEDFFRTPSPLVDLKLYNLARARIIKKINAARKESR